MTAHKCQFGILYVQIKSGDGLMCSAAVALNSSVTRLARLCSLSSPLVSLTV